MGTVVQREQTGMIRQHHKRGFSLVEAAIVLAVVGLVVAGTWVAAATTIENNKRNTTLEIITTAVYEIRRSLNRVYFSDEYDLTDFSASIGAIPSNKKSPYGDLFIRAELNQGGDFKILLYKLGPKTCVFLFNKIANSDAVSKSGLMRIGILSGGGYYRTSFPVPMSEIEAKCSVSEGNIYFQYKY